MDDSYLVARRQASVSNPRFSLRSSWRESKETGSETSSKSSHATARCRLEGSGLACLCTFCATLVSDQLSCDLHKLILQQWPLLGTVA